MNINIKYFFLAAALISLTSCGGSSSSSNSQEAVVPPLVEEDTSNDPPAGPPIAESSTFLAPINELEVGMCGDFVQEVSGIGFMNVTDCETPHLYQIAGSFDLVGSDDEFPGDFILEQSTYIDCRPAFEQYTGQEYTGIGLGIEVLPPNADTWSEGDRTVICMVVNADRSPLSTSVGV